MPYSIQDFAGAIKAKYPDYSKVDDTLLVSAYVKKHPEYKNAVQLEQMALPDTESALSSYGSKYGVAKSFANSVIGVESGGDTGATSHKGAGGMMQIMPETFSAQSKKLGLNYTEQDRYDPIKNIEIGVSLLGESLDKYKTKEFPDGDPRFALVSYHAGDGVAKQLYDRYVETGVFDVPRNSKLWDGKLDGNGSPVPKTGMYTADYVDKIMSRWQGEQKQVQTQGQQGGTQEQLSEDSEKWDFDRWTNEIDKSINRGGKQNAVLLAYSAAAEGKMSIDEAKKIEKDLGITGGSAKRFLERGVTGFAEMLPMMAGGVLQGAKYAAGGAAAAGAAGMIGGPETAAAGATLGASMGLQYGMIEHWRKIGQGDIYKELIDSGGDPEKSKPISRLMSIPYAALEHVQVLNLIPGVGALKGIVTKSLFKTFAKLAAKYVVKVGTEDITEGLQKGVSRLAVDVEQRINNAKVPQPAKEAAIGILKASFKEMVDVLPTMVIAPVGGTAVEAYKVPGMVKQEQTNQKVDEFLNQTKKSADEQNPSFGGFGDAESFVENNKDLLDVKDDDNADNLAGHAFFTDLTVDERSEVVDLINQKKKEITDRQVEEKKVITPGKGNREGEPSSVLEDKLNELDKLQTVKSGDIGIGQRFVSKSDGNTYTIVEASDNGVMAQSVQMSVDGEPLTVNKFWPSLQNFKKETKLNAITAGTKEKAEIQEKEQDIVERFKEPKKAPVVEKKDGAKQVKSVEKTKADTTEDLIRSQEEHKTAVETKRKESTTPTTVTTRRVSDKGTQTVAPDAKTPPQATTEDMAMADESLTETPVKTKQKKSKFESFTDQQIIEHARSTLGLADQIDAMSDEQRVSFVQKFRQRISHGQRPVGYVKKDQRSRKATEAKISLLEKARQGVPYSKEYDQFLSPTTKYVDESGKTTYVPSVEKVEGSDNLILTEAGAQHISELITGRETQGSQFKVITKGETKAGTKIPVGISQTTTKTKPLMVGQETLTEDGETIGGIEEVSEEKDVSRVYEEEDENTGEKKRVHEILQNNLRGGLMASISPSDDRVAFKVGTQGTSEEVARGKSIAKAHNVIFNGAQEGVYWFTDTTPGRESTFITPIDVTPNEFSAKLKSVRSSMTSPTKASRGDVSQQQSASEDDIAYIAAKVFSILPDELSERIVLQIGNVVRTVGKDGKVHSLKIGKGHSAKATVAFGKNGQVYVTIGADLSKLEAALGAIHEGISHFGFEKVIGSNKNVDKAVWKAFMGDRDSDFTKALEDRYEEDMMEIYDNTDGSVEEKLAASEDFLRKEWLAKRSEEIVRQEILDDNYNVKKGSDPVLTKIWEAIKYFVKDLFGKNTTDDQVKMLSRKMLGMLRDGKYDKGDVGGQTMFSRNESTKPQQRSLVEAAKTAKEARMALVEYAMKNLKKEDLRKSLLSKVKNIKDVNSKEFADALDEIDRIRELGDRRRAVARMKGANRWYSRTNLSEESDKKIKGLMAANPISDISKIDHRAVSEAADEIRKTIFIERKEQKELKKYNKTEFEHNVDETVRTLEESAKILKKDKKSENVFANAAKDVGEAYSLAFSNPKTITNEVDGWSNGFITKNVYSVVNDGVTEQYRFKQKMEDEIGGFLDDNNIKVGSWSNAFGKAKTTEMSIGGKPVEITTAQRIALFLHSQNDDNLRHVLGGGIRLEYGKRKPLYRITVEELVDIVNSVKSNKQELAVANKISEWLNTTQKEAINENSMQLNGYALATVNNYFPLQSAGVDITKVYQEEITPSSMISTFRNQMHGPESSGALQARKKSSSPILLEDAFEALVRSNNVAAKYIGLAGPLQHVRNLLGNSSVKNAFEENGFDRHYKELMSYVERMHGIKINRYEYGARRFYNLYTIGKLGFNLGVSVKQVMSLPAAFTMLDIKDYSPGFSNPERIRQYYEESKKYSPQLRSRWEGLISINIGELMKSAQARRVFAHKKTFGSTAMSWVTFVDTVAISQIWHTVKQEAVRKGYEKNSKEYWEYVRTRTEDVVEQTQPTFEQKDRSSATSSEGFILKPITMFVSQRNKNFMMIRRALGKWNTGKKSEAVRDIGNVVLVQSLMLASIDKARRELPKFIVEKILNKTIDDDDDIGKLSWYYRFMADTLRYGISSFIGTQGLLSHAISFFLPKDVTKELYLRRPFETPIAGAVVDVARLADLIGDYGIQERIYGDGKTGFKRLSYKRDDEKFDKIFKQSMAVASHLGAPVPIVRDLFGIGKTIYKGVSQP